MIIKGKKLSLLRLAGASLVLIGMITSLFLDFFIFNRWYIFVILIFCFLPWVILSFGLKFELNYLKSNISRVLIVLGISSAILAILGLTFSTNIQDKFLFTPVLISNFLILICWHYIPSIYKREKIYSILSGIGFVLLNILTKMNLFCIKFGFATAIISILLVSIGIALTLIVEQIMRNNGLLNYV